MVSARCASSLAGLLLAGALMGCGLSGCGPSAEAYPFLREAGCETPCEPDAGPPDAGRGDAGPPEIPDEPLEDWDTEGAGPLSGIYAVEVRIPARAVVEVETRQLYRLRVLQRDEQVRMKITPCRFLLPSIPGLATLRLPPRLEETLRGISIEEEGPFLSAADPIGAALSTPAVTVLLGAELADIEADPLPTAEDLSSAIDQDEDGQPGVTLGAETVLCTEPEEIYVALRAGVQMSATVESTETFTGQVEPTLEQSVLGVSEPCLNTAASLEIELLEGSTFTAQRVGEAQDLDANGNLSCPELAWHATPLFGEAWAQ